MSKSAQHDRNRRNIQRQVGNDRDTGAPIMKGKGMEHPAAADTRAYQEFLRSGGDKRDWVNTWSYDNMNDSIDLIGQEWHVGETQ